MKINFFSPFISIAVCLLSPALAAAPTGADLLTACSASLETGFDGAEGQLCTWYVYPCNCGVDKDIPQVCLPNTVSTGELARDVIAGLEQQSVLSEQDASRAAAIILSEKYPCPASVD